MTTTPERYQPDTRLIDDPDELARLYHERDCTIGDIASDHASVGQTRVYEALAEHGLLGDRDERQTTDGPENRATNADLSSNSTRSGNRGRDPPPPSRTTPHLDWSVHIE